MIIHLKNRTVVLFGQHDVLTARAIAPDLVWQQENLLRFDEPEVFAPCLVAEEKLQAILMLSEGVPQFNRAPCSKHPGTGCEHVSDDDQADVTGLPAEVEMKFSSLDSLDTFIAWLTTLRGEFAKALGAEE